MQSEGIKRGAAQLVNPEKEKPKPSKRHSFCHRFSLAA